MCVSVHLDSITIIMNLAQKFLLISVSYPTFIHSCIHAPRVTHTTAKTDLRQIHRERENWMVASIFDLARVSAQDTYTKSWQWFNSLSCFLTLMWAKWFTYFSGQVVGNGEEASRNEIVKNFHVHLNGYFCCFSLFWLIWLVGYNEKFQFEVKWRKFHLSWTIWAEKSI